jgi:hypothetical protein
MKMFIFSIFLLSLMLGNGSVDPSYRYTSARGIGVGNAYSALVDDYSAVFVNPASISRYDKAQIGIMQSNIISDVNLINGSLIIPGKVGLGLGFYYIGTEIPVATWDADKYVFSNMLGFNDITLLGSMSTAINNNLLLGLTGKFRLANADTYNTSAINADFGALYQFNPAFNLSFVYQNFLPLKITVQNGGEDEMQQKMTIGGAYRLLGKESGAMIYSKGQSFDFSTDIEIVGNQMMYRFGGEYKPSDFLAFRLGYGNEKWASSSSNTNEVNLFSVGIGLNFNGYYFDYAYSMDPNKLESNNSHYFSIAIDLSQPKKETEEFTGDYLSLITPEDKHVTYERNHQLLGTVVPQVASVKVNGIETPIQNNRIFQNIRFDNYGKQKIEVAAYDQNERLLEARTIRNLYLMSFNDVSKHNWARQYIEELTTLGLLRPEKNQELFNITGYISRGEYAYILAKLRNLDISFLDISNGYKFQDTANNKYRDYIELVAQFDLMTGIDNDNFAPDSHLTREQIVASLVKLEGLNVPEKALRSRFGDVSVKRWSARFIEVAVDNGLINGYNDGTFQPTRKVTRAECAKIVHNTTMGQKIVKDLFDWDNY